MITLADIEAARDRLTGHVLMTPLVPAVALSEALGASISLKLEHYQTTGSFKLRGATNAMLRLSDEERQRGVVTASTGNHGRALSAAASAAGARATICISNLVPENKVAEIRRLGATVHIVGQSQDDAWLEAVRLAEQDGLVIIPPFDHRDVIAGQGTIGLEIVAAQPDVGTVLVPLSGGGLAAGVAAAVKALRPQARIIGVSMENGAAMKASLDAGHPVAVGEFPSLADSLGGGIGLDNQLTFQMCRDLLDDVVLLTEAEIAAGVRHAYQCQREVVEGAGAVGIAALLAGKITDLGRPIAVILSGRNIDMALHYRLAGGADGLLGEE